MCLKNVPEYETEGRYMHIIADGNIYTSGDAAKAIACGADAVMLGLPLADAAEAAAHGLFWPSTAGHPRFPRGAVYSSAVFLFFPIYSWYIKKMT